MIFRRRKGADAGQSEPVDEPAEEAADEPADEPAEELAALATHRERVGPWDVEEREIDGADERAVDLGGLIITARVGLELRLQTDQASGAVGAAMLVGRNSAVEIRVFAASRSGGIWDEIRREIAAEASKRGGTATESDGPYGPELRLRVPVQDPKGRSTTQVSRIVGIEGPRWLLRATYLGDAATRADPDGLLESAVRDIVVVRGAAAMPPREPIPLRLPSGADQPPTEEADGPA